MDENEIIELLRKVEEMKEEGTSSPLSKHKLLELCELGYLDYSGTGYNITDKGHQLLNQSS